MSELLSPELQSKIALWRQKANDGTLTLEEQKEAILLLRAGRKNALTAQAASASKTKKAKAAIPDADSLLDELGGLA